MAGEDRLEEGLAWIDVGISTQVARAAVERTAEGGDLEHELAPELKRLPGFQQFGFDLEDKIDEIRSGETEADNRLRKEGIRIAFQGMALLLQAQKLKKAVNGGDTSDYS